MAQNRRLIDANQIPFRKSGFPESGGVVDSGMDWAFREDVDRLPTVDAVEVVRIKALKREILRRMDEFIAEYRRLSKSLDDHFGGKADAMEVARRLVNAAITDLIEAPAIEAEPVRHGQWIPDDYEYNHCSECGFEHDEPEYVTPYCPNCGANMDSED